MKNIVISCPYSGLEALKEAILNRSEQSVNIITDGDIHALDQNQLYLDKSQKLDLASITAAYVRYPYDLIPPHTQTYTKREYTEFLKTLALLLDHVALNKIKNAHFARNRFYSLKTAEDLGLKTPAAMLIRNEKVPVENKRLSKSLGNCYFGEDIEKNKSSLSKKILQHATDGSESAYIYDPHLVQENETKDHVAEFGSYYVQNYIEGSEFRVYLVDSHILVYKRKSIEAVDKSAAGLELTNSDLITKFNSAFYELQNKLGLRYLCMDMIIADDELYVIDINPFGSFPRYSENPDVTNRFADSLLQA